MDWTRARPLLAKLIDLPAEQRLAQLEKECDGEPELKRQIERLLLAGSAWSGLFEPDGGGLHGRETR